MNRSPCSLVLLLLLVPLTSLGQSYEWFDRIASPEGGWLPPVATEMFQVAPSEYGTYSVGYTDCYYPTCSALLSKYSNEDGKLLWRRKFTFDVFTRAYTLAVNAAGVFVAGQSFAPGVGGGFVRLYSHDGDTLWTRRDLQRPEVALDSVADDTGVYVVGGKTGNRMVVHRLSNTGETLWTRVMSEGSGYSNYIMSIELSDNRLYVSAEYGGDVKIIRASDGAWLGSFLNGRYGVRSMSYHDGFLYLAGYGALGYGGLAKFSVAGDEIWRYTFDPERDGLIGGGAILASDEGVVVSAEFRWPYTLDKNGLIAGSALMHFELDGSVREVVEYPGHWVEVNHLATRDGVLYAAGFHGQRYNPLSLLGDRAAYTARYSNKPLVRPSLLSLAGATPAMPPRLAVMYHEYGAGPMRVGIRDAAPDSPEYRFEFSEGLKPVSFDKVADLNGNGYEEMVVVSRLPAAAEIRDSLDGSLVATIKLGSHLEPLQATVEQRDGTPPRLAVVARNRDNDNLLLRIYNLESGNLLATNFYQPGFDPVDVVALPDPNNSGARRYALLARNRLAGEPNKVEIRGGNGNMLENLWLGSDREPLQLAVTGAGVDGLAVLRYAAASSDLDVLRIDLATSAQQRLRFSANLTPAAMLELPDSNGNGAPQYAVYGEETGAEPVKAETRDLATGALDHTVFTGSNYRPENAAYVGPVPGFSDEAFALLGFRHEKGRGNDTHDNGGLRVALADVDGTKLFDLTFFAEP